MKIELLARYNSFVSGWLGGWIGMAISIAIGFARSNSIDCQDDRVIAQSQQIVKFL
jgi:hypothetical protein